MSRFKSEEHRNQRAILICYKFARRRGHDRDSALQNAYARHARLSASAAVLIASDFTANPILIAAQANMIMPT